MRPSQGYPKIFLEVRQLKGLRPLTSAKSGREQDKIILTGIIGLGYEGLKAISEQPWQPGRLAGWPVPPQEVSLAQSGSQPGKDQL